MANLFSEDLNLMSRWRVEKMDVIDNELLFKYIHQTGLSYSELARKIEISRNTIYNVSLGRTSPSYSVINSFADSLEFTREDFIAIFFPKIKFKEEFSPDEPTK